MKLKIGMYARLDGKIGKIVEVCKCEQCELRGYYEPVIEYTHKERDYVSVYWKDNLKASYNIIDLIEVGDYVNGSEVTSIEENGWLGFGNNDWYIPNSRGIKSIVTKEQFESMSYKVGE